jgi:hypothetical protein
MIQLLQHKLSTQNAQSTPKLPFKYKKKMKVLEHAPSVYPTPTKNPYPMTHQVP